MLLSFLSPSTNDEKVLWGNNSITERPNSILSFFHIRFWGKFVSFLCFRLSTDVTNWQVCSLFQEFARGEKNVWELICYNFEFESNGHYRTCPNCLADGWTLLIVLYSVSSFPFFCAFQVSFSSIFCCCCPVCHRSCKWSPLFTCPTCYEKSSQGV